MGLCTSNVVWYRRRTVYGQSYSFANASEIIRSYNDVSIAQATHNMLALTCGLKGQLWNARKMSAQSAMLRSRTFLVTLTRCEGGTEPVVSTSINVLAPGASELQDRISCELTRTYRHITYFNASASFVLFKTNNLRRQ